MVIQALIDRKICLEPIKTQQFSLDESTLLFRSPGAAWYESEMYLGT